jgi:hypothetical protein
LSWPLWSGKIALLQIVILDIMEQSLKVKTAKLTPELVEGLKKYFHAIKATEITISFSTPKRKSRRKETQEETNARIEQSVKDMENGDFISFTAEEFLQMSRVLKTIKTIKE